MTVVRSGSKDGLTRAERAELEAKLKRDLPGAWVDDAADSKSVYTFTDGGRFEAARYKVGKKVGGHIGTWSVSGARMTLRVTESADDWVETGGPFEVAVTDVKSEGGRVFKFKITRSDPVAVSRHLTKLQADDVTTDEAKAGHLVGVWAVGPSVDKVNWEFKADSTFKSTSPPSGTGGSAGHGGSRPAC